jgi:hypothetical protein
VAELNAADAVVIDPILIPNLKALLARRANNPNNFEAGLKFYLARNPNSPIKSHQDNPNSPRAFRLPRRTSGRIRRLRSMRHAT